MSVGPGGKWGPWSGPRHPQAGNPGQGGRACAGWSGEASKLLFIHVASHKGGIELSAPSFPIDPATSYRTSTSLVCLSESSRLARPFSYG